MDAERISNMHEQADEPSAGVGPRPGETLFGLRSPDRPVDDNNYPTAWIMTDEEYEQHQRVMKGGE